MLRLALTIGLLLAPATLSAQGLAIGFDPDPFEHCATPAEVAAAQGVAEKGTVPERRVVRIGERTIKLSVADQRADPLSAAAVSQR